MAGLNDFVIRFANVNGTGSASANSLMARCFYKMGIPIGAKNLFPSNIQGLPTWYEVRVNDKGYIARRGGVDLMISMNPQSFKEDTASVVPGGYFFYDSTKFLPVERRRTDIEYLGVPLAQMAIEVFSNPKTRGMLQNIIYVGALSALLDVERQVAEDLLREEFAAKPKVIDMNLQAFALGYEFTQKEFKCPLPLRVERRDLIGDKILIEGNDAAALGCLFAGATALAWYPITPSTSVADAFAKYCSKYRKDPAGKNRYAIVQAEDELAAIGMVLGASWNGSRAFTATSGPGISLMSEFLGFAYYAEVPVVLFDVQRTGPSTGMPTRTQQSDLISCAYASHGDTKHILLFPQDPEECFTMATAAFDLADRLQTPVIVMLDLDLGMNEWLSKPFTWDDKYQWDRGKVLTSKDLDAMTQRGEHFYRYLDKDNDGIAYRTYPATHPSKGSFFTRGSGHDRFGRYTEDADLYRDNMDRLTKKFNTAKSAVPQPVIDAAGRDWGVIYFGTTSWALLEARDRLEKDKIAFDTLRIRAFPFSDSIRDFCLQHKHLVVVEQNRDAQLRMMLAGEVGVPMEKMRSVTVYDGLQPTASQLATMLREQMGGHR